MRKKITGALIFASSLPALAAVPDDVTAAISAMKTDAVAVAVAVLVAIIAVMAVKFIRKGMS